MKTAAQAIQEISRQEIDFRIRFRIFVSLLFYVSGFLAMGYLVFWKPLLNRWIF